MTDYFEERPSEEIVEDKPYRYLDVYEVDKWARDRDESPIEFDWSRVHNVEGIEPDKDWANNPANIDAAKKGRRYLRFLVFCSNPKHGYFKQVFPDPPTDWSYRCQKCITDEMDRIIGLRVKRDEEYRRGHMEVGA